MTKQTPPTPTNPDFWAMGFHPATVAHKVLSQSVGWHSAAGNAATGLLQVQRHWLGFLSDRLKQDAALLERLAGCSSPAEATTAAMDFCTTAVGAYQNEFVETARLTASATLTAAPAPVATSTDSSGSD